jgi:Ca2+-binding RTX toxin-like protein
LLVPVTTVPGVLGGTIDLQFSTQQNAQLAAQLLHEVYAAAAAGILDVRNTPTNPPAGSGDIDEFTIGDQGGVPNTGQNAATVPSGYTFIVDAFTAAPATVTGAPGQLNEAVLSGQGGLTFFTNGGSGTVLAGGGNNLVAPGPGAPDAASSWTLLFDGGSNTVSGPVGNLFIDDGSSTTAGSNRIFLGSGADTVLSWGIDLIVAAPGGNAVIDVYHAGSSVYGNSGNTEVLNLGGEDTVVQGSGQATLFAGATGGLYFGGGGALTFLAAPNTDSTVVAGVGNATLYANASNDLFFVGGGPFMLAGGSGSQTVVGTSGFSGSAVIFSEGGGSAVLFGNTDGNQLIAGAGNVTLNAGGASGNEVFFAGTGNDLIVGSSGSNFIMAGPGDDTMVGGAGVNLFQVARGVATGGSELIANWTAADQLYLPGYGAAGPHRLPAGAAITVVKGSAVLSLDDGTRITFLGVSNVSTHQIHSS